MLIGTLILDDPIVTFTTAEVDGMPNNGAKYTTYQGLGKGFFCVRSDEC